MIYVVLEEVTSEKLESKVNELLEGGEYILYGSIQISQVVIQTNSASAALKKAYVQTLIKKPKKKVMKRKVQW